MFRTRHNTAEVKYEGNLLESPRDMQTPSVFPKCNCFGEESAVNVEATGSRAHYIDGASEPYN